MAKRLNGSTATLPEPATAQRAPRSASVEKGEKESTLVELSAPMHRLEPGYCTNHIHFQGMTNRQRAAAKRLVASLDAANERIEMVGVRYPKGKVVHDHGDAVRWMLERLADAFERATGQDITDGLKF